jgi:hypothetical protein
VELAKRNVSEACANAINDGHEIHFMIDIWQHKKMSVLAIIVTTMSKYEKKHLLAAVYDGRVQSHTGAWVAQCFTRCLDEYEIPSSKIGTITSDAGSNLKSAYRQLGQEHVYINCACHLLHRYVVRL